MHKLALLALCCLCFSVRAQAPASPQPTIRYQFGDDMRWADPNFDDRMWPVAENGLVPSRSRETNRFLWVRIHIPVPIKLNGQPALYIAGLGVQPMTWRVFLDGHAVGGEGDYPPHLDPAAVPVSPVIRVPAQVNLSSSEALVALREWHAPSFLESGVPSHPVAIIDDARVLDREVRAQGAEALVARGPEYALSGVLELAGALLLVFWRSSRRPEYLWAAIMLLTPLFNSILTSGPVATRLSYRAAILTVAVVYSAGLLAEIELMWTLFRLHHRWLRVLWHSIWIAFIIALIAGAYTLQSPALLRLWQTIILVGIAAFDSILFPVCIREMFRRNGNRAIAAAQALFEVIVALGTLGYSVHLALGPFRLDLFNLTVILLDFAIGAMLLQRAWRAWKQSNSLRAELEAAREVQQQLVTAPPATPSFRIESAYVPATQVGGDFYRILPSEHGDILVVVGDVSGKGLRAAMTVSAIIGSLRTLAACEPASVLRDLNRSLAGQLPSGFVTCLAARLRADGNCSIANAGHLAPYRRGEEISLPSGLPLGITADADYPEIIFQLAAGDTLTFLSDGVVEAQTPSGELFGFDRTRAISSNSAQSIADAAVRFGQEDEITVLTVEFAPDVAS